MQIIFLSPHVQHPVGGIREIHNMVDLLNLYNINSIVAYYNTDERTKINWFEHNTNTTLLKDINIDQLEPDDIIVIPEVNGDMVGYFPKHLRKIIFNQNATYALERMSTLQRFCTKENNVTDMIYVSDHNKHMMIPFFPHLNHHRIHLRIDETLFNYSSEKKFQLAYMLRKNPRETLSIISKIKDVPCIPIQNMTHKQVANVLKESLIFLNYSVIEHEGFLLPPAEAMACGCIVISNTSGGSSEYMLPEYCYPMLSEKHKANMHKMVSYVVNQYKDNPQVVIDKGKKASDFILHLYSQKQYINDVLDVWNTILHKDMDKIIKK